MARSLDAGDLERLIDRRHGLLSPIRSAKGAKSGVVIVPHETIFPGQQRCVYLLIEHALAVNGELSVLLEGRGPSSSSPPSSISDRGERTQAALELLEQKHTLASDVLTLLHPDHQRVHGVDDERLLAEQQEYVQRLDELLHDALPLDGFGRYPDIVSPILHSVFNSVLEDLEDAIPNPPLRELLSLTRRKADDAFGLTTTFGGYLSELGEIGTRLGIPTANYASISTFLEALALERVPRFFEGVETERGQLIERLCALDSEPSRLRMHRRAIRAWYRKMRPFEPKLAAAAKLPGIRSDLGRSASLWSIFRSALRFEYFAWAGKATFGDQAVVAFRKQARSEWRSLGRLFLRLVSGRRPLSELVAQGLLMMSAAYRTGTIEHHAYYLHLTELLKTLDLFPSEDTSIHRYIVYLETARASDPTSVVERDVPMLVEALVERCAPSAVERRVVALRQEIERFERLVTLRLTREDLERIPPQWSVGDWLARLLDVAGVVLPRSSMPSASTIDMARTTARIFESLAVVARIYYLKEQERSQAMVERAMERVRSGGLSLIVCARRHVCAFERALENEKRVSFAVCRPGKLPAKDTTIPSSFGHFTWLRVNEDVALHHRTPVDVIRERRSPWLAAGMQRVSQKSDVWAQPERLSTAELTLLRSVLTPTFMKHFGENEAAAKEFLDSLPQAFETFVQTGQLSRQRARMLAKRTHAMFERARAVGIEPMFQEVSREIDMEKAEERLNRLREPLERFISDGRVTSLKEARRAFMSLSQQNQIDDLEPDARILAYAYAAEILERSCEWLEDVDDLQRAITCWEHVVSLGRAGSDDDALYRSRLGLTLCQAFGTIGDDALLTRALETLRQGTALSASHGVVEAFALAALSRGLELEHAHAGTPEGLEAAARTAQDALSALLPSSLRRVQTLRLAASVLVRMFEVNGDLALVDQAILSLQEARDLAKDQPADLASIWAALGRALSARYAREENPTEGNEARVHLMAAAVSLPDEAPEKSSILGSLGEIDIEIYEHTGARSNLTSALDALMRAMELAPERAPQRRRITNVISLGMMRRYQRTGTASDLAAAIDSVRTALEPIPQWNVERASLLCTLADLLRERAQREDFEQIRAHYADACRLGLNGSMAWALRSSHHWGSWAFEHGTWDEALEALRIAARARESLLTIQVIRRGKEAWLRETRNVMNLAAYAAARSDAREGAAEAVLFLERGRTHFLADALEREQARIESLETSHPELLKRYKAAAERVARFEATELREGTEIVRGANLDDAREAYADVAACASAIRRLPGCADLFAPLAADLVDQLVSSLEPSVGLVYFVTTPAGSLALIITRAGVEAMFPDLRETELDEMLTDSDGEVAHFNGSLLARSCGAIGPKLVAPVAKRLKELGVDKLVIIPVGKLAALPLHAARISERGCLQDGLCVSYAPSMRVWRLAVRSEPTSHESSTFVGIGNPMPHSMGLPAADAEVQEIGRLFRDRANILRGSGASRQALSRVTAQATYLHFATHGRFEPDTPLDSALSLSMGELLTLRDVLFGDFKPRQARLVVLSACESAVTDVRHLPDEFMGMPAAFLQAGVPGVIGTLWAIDDLACALIMTKFYELYLSNDGFRRDAQLPPGEALRQAQFWFRRVTHEDLHAYFKEHEQLRAAQQAWAQKKPESVFANLERLSREGPGVAPFAGDVGDWAAFIFVGV